MHATMPYAAHVASIDTPASTSATAVYASVTGCGEIAVLHQPADAGAPLHEVQRLSLGGAPMPMAFSPDRRRLYVVDRGERNRVHTLAIDPVDGRLGIVGTAPLAGNMAYAATSADGRFLFTASYEGDMVAVNAIDGQGVAGDVVQHLPTPRHAHAIVPAPSGDAVWITCLGADAILGRRFDARTGLMDDTPSWTHACRARSGPRHAVFHPHAPWCFVINEWDGSIDTLALPDADADAPAPRLVSTARLMGTPFTQTPWAAEIRLSPDGRRLFASERRTAMLLSFEVDTSSGALRRAGHLQVDEIPRSFALSPCGTRIHVASQQSGSLTTVAVDPETGGLARLGGLHLGRSPTWVETLALTPR